MTEKGSKEAVRSLPLSTRAMKREDVLRLAHRIGDVACGNEGVVDSAHNVDECHVCARIADMMIDFFTPDPEMLPEAPRSLLPVEAPQKADRYSTREIVTDAVGHHFSETARNQGKHRLGHNPSWVKAADYDALATALSASVEAPPTQKRRCVIGEYCSLHKFIHGAEAEELRERFEKLLRGHRTTFPGSAILHVLEDVDARDSCAFVETKPEECE